MRTKFIYLLLIAAVSGSAAAQDTLSLDDYRLRVLQYSYTLKQAAEQTRAAEAARPGQLHRFPASTQRRAGRLFDQLPKTFSERPAAETLFVFVAAGSGTANLRRRKRPR